MTRVHRQLLFFAAFSALLLLAAAVGAVDLGLLPYCAPVVVAVLPLLAGRFLGEETFTRAIQAVRRRHGRIKSSPQSAARACARLLARGGALIAEAVAKRPPPTAALVR